MQCHQHKISYRNIKPVIASDLADNTEPAWLLTTDHTVDGLAVCYYNVLAHCFDPPQILFPNIKLIIFAPLKLLTTLPYPDAPVLYFKFLDFYLARSTSGYYNIPPPSHSHSILTISYCLLHSCLSCLSFCSPLDGVNITELVIKATSSNHPSWWAQL